MLEMVLAGGDGRRPERGNDNTPNEETTMGAMKRFYEDCAEAGRCPVSVETLDYLDDVECENRLDWIGYCEHDYRSAVTGLLVSHECITLESARRLIAEGMANDEIESFVGCFGGPESA